jgi:hypothetical protein
MSDSATGPILRGLSDGVIQEAIVTGCGKYFLLEST